MDTDIKTLVAKMPTRLMERNYNFPDYESDEKHLEELEHLLDQIELIFKMGKEKAQELLGEEFKFDDYLGLYKMPMPLFIHIDIIKIAIEQNMSSTTNLNDRKKAVIRRLDAIRKLAIDLSYNKIFDPNKHMSNSVIDNISSSKGEFTFKVERVDGEVYLKLYATSTYQTVDYRNGDIYNSSASYLHYSNFAFREDEELNKKRRFEKIKPLIDEVTEAIKGYFIDDKVPKIRNVDHLSEYYKDYDLDLEVSYYLTEIVGALIKVPVDEVKLRKSYEEFKTYVKVPKAKDAELNVKAPIEQITKPDVKESELKKETKEKKSIFTRFKGKLNRKKKDISPLEASSAFEKERVRQLSFDEEKRKYVIFERKIIDNQEVLIPVSDEEYKVVRR